MHFWLYSAPFNFCIDAERADRDHTLFASSTANPNYCIHQLFPPARSEHIPLRDSGHPYTLPTCTFDLFKTVLLTDAYLVLFSFLFLFYVPRFV